MNSLSLLQLIDLEGLGTELWHNFHNHGIRHTISCGKSVTLCLLRGLIPSCSLILLTHTNSKEICITTRTTRTKTSLTRGLQEAKDHHDHKDHKTSVTMTTTIRTTKERRRPQGLRRLPGPHRLQVSRRQRPQLQWGPLPLKRLWRLERWRR